MSTHQDHKRACETLRMGLAPTDENQPVLDAVAVLERWYETQAAGEKAETQEAQASRPPAEYLKNWQEILVALGRTNNREERRFVAALNRQYAGPIILPGRGGRPKAEKTKLIGWWNHLEIVWQTQGGGRSSTDTVKEQYPYGRRGIVVPNIGGHVRKKRGMN